MIRDGALLGAGGGISVPVDDFDARRIYAVFVGGFASDRWLSTITAGMGHAKETETTAGISLARTGRIDASCGMTRAFAIQVGVRWLAGSIELYVSPRVAAVSAECALSPRAAF